MSIYCKLPITLLLLFCSITIFAQGKKTEANALIKQGAALHDAGKFADAIAKYDEALKVDPDNTGATYEKAFSLHALGKDDEGIPLLEKVIKENTEPGAYNLLGNIYDDKKDFDKSISYYNKGIAAFPKYQRLYYNLSVSYLFQKKYAEAEAAATEAIKLDQRHASSHRAYAMATYNEGKHVNSLLAWCNFLIIEPQTQRSVEACNYIKHILYANVKGNNMTVGGTDEQTRAQQMTIALGVSGGLAISNAEAAKKGNGTPVTALDSLSIPLQYIFKITDEKRDPGVSVFFNKYYAQFFGALAKTEYMDSFVRYITLSVFRNDDIAWLKEHQDNIKALTVWVNTYKREFE
jgi:tetratricopeptide (TPR) repeat protein